MNSVKDSQDRKKYTLNDEFKIQVLVMIDLKFSLKGVTWNSDSKVKWNESLVGQYEWAYKQWFLNVYSKYSYLLRKWLCLQRCKIILKYEYVYVSNKSNPLVINIMQFHLWLKILVYNLLLPTSFLKVKQCPPCFPLKYLHLNP